MGETEIILILSIVTAVILIFIAGIFIFVTRYRNRQQQNEQEKIALEKQYKLDLLNNQLMVQQQTMQFIGNEIHDSVAQKLTLATLYTQKMEYENKFPEASGKLNEIGSIINDSLEELRNLSRTLSSNTIRDKELPELIEMECRKINGSGVCRLEAALNGTPAMSFIVKSSLLRIIQEFIQNSLKHSGCSLINIRLDETPDEISVLISDNGKGFDMNGPASDGIGLNNIKRRIDFIGGTSSIQSQVGSGTTLRLYLNHKKLMSQ